MKLFALLGLIVMAVMFSSCEKKQESPASSAPDLGLTTNGTIEVSAELMEIPSGAIFQKGMYDYATVLKYRVLKVHRGQVDGDTIFVGHYDPWKPRNQAADTQVPNIGGNIQQLQPKRVHRMALEVPIEDHFTGSMVNKYFGQTTNVIYFAVWANQE